MNGTLLRRCGRLCDARHSGNLSIQKHALDRLDNIPYVFYRNVFLRSGIGNLSSLSSRPIKTGHPLHGDAQTPISHHALCATLPYIWGYKPRHNYQALKCLVDEVL